MSMYRQGPEYLGAPDEISFLLNRGLHRLKRMACGMFDIR